MQLKTLAISVLAAAALIAPALAVVSSTPAQAATATYGAYAYSPTNHNLIKAGTGITALAAEDNARSACESAGGGPACIPAGWYHAAYAATAIGSGSGTARYWGWGYNTTLAGAKSNALKFCGTGHSCKITSTTSVGLGNRNTTGSVLPGRVCLFDAPNSGLQVPGGIYSSGHVGWAFLENRENGTWKAGANEGPALMVKGFPVYGTSSSDWTDAGQSWSQVVSDFRAQVNGFEWYRCQSLPSWNNTAASAKYTAQLHEKYTVPNSDCLSDAVNILRAYGANGLAASFSSPLYPNAQPSWYFLNALSNFSPITALGS